MPRRSPREKSVGPMLQTALRLPKEMHSRLEKVGKKSGLGVSGEIRQRLETSLASDDDAGTQEIQASIAELVKLIRQITGKPWHSTSYGYDVFKSGLSTLLGFFQPEEDLRTPEIADVLFDDVEPKAVGRTLAAIAAQQYMPDRIQ